MHVTKRGGILAEYDVEKIHKVVQWATNGINGVSFSDIVMNANLSIYDKIETTVSLFVFQDYPWMNCYNLFTG